MAACAAALLVLFLGTAAATPDDILARARQAYGTTDWNHAGVLVESGSEQSSGLKGRWRRVVDVVTGRMRETVDYKVFRLASVWDGHVQWRQDHSGGAHALNSSFARAYAATDMWLARRGYLRADGARVVALGEHHDGSRSFNTLRATPAGGEPVELWFDSASGLLAKYIRVMPTDTLTVRYEDYRRVGSTMVPFRVIAQEGDSDPDTITLDNAKFDSASQERAFTPPQTPDDSTVAGGVATVPIAFDGDVVIEAKLNGKGPFAFILDTGGHDILTPDAAKALGLSGAGSGSSGGAGAGTMTEQYTRVARMEIGGVSLRDQAFFIDPLQYNTIEIGSRPPLAGILGVELFERFAIELNYQAKTMTFRPLHGAPPGHGTPVAITFADDQPIFSAKIDGIAGDNGLDTGNSGALVVQGRWAQAHGLAPRMRKGLLTAGFGAGGMSQNWAVRADLEVAGVAFPHIAASYAEDKKGAFASRTEAGNIGNLIYSHFTLSFDYGRNIVWFDPLPGPHRPFTYPRAGMSFYKQTADAFVVAIALPAGPAAQAGVAAGDEIVAVNGVTARKLSGWDMRRLVRGAVGTKLKLDVMRGGKKRTAMVVLRELLP